MRTDRLSSMRCQRGASALGAMIMVLFFGSLLTLGIKLGPSYLDDLTIRKTLESLDETEGLADMRPPQIRTLIDKRLSVNNIRAFDPKNIRIEKDGDLVRLSVDYEVRNHVISNVDAVLRFQHEYELKGK